MVATCMVDTNTRFHMFSQLPTELRLKIWFFALNDIGRVVEIECEKGIGPGNRRYIKTFTSTTPVPAVMSVNQESRFEALAIYQPYFQTELRPTGIYVAFDQDTIAFPDEVFNYLGELELQRIQSMILKLRDYANFGHYHFDTLRRMQKLEVLELRVEKWLVSQWDRGDKMESLTNDLLEEIELHPEWTTPSIRIVSKYTGETVMLGNVLG